MGKSKPASALQPAQALRLLRPQKEAIIASPLRALIVRLAERLAGTRVGEKFVTG